MNNNSRILNQTFSGTDGQGQPPSANWYEVAIAFSISLTAYRLKNTQISALLQVRTLNLVIGPVYCKKHFNPREVLYLWVNGTYSTRDLILVGKFSGNFVGFWRVSQRGMWLDWVCHAGYLHLQARIQGDGGTCPPRPSKVGPVTPQTLCSIFRLCPPADHPLFRLCPPPDHPLFRLCPPPDHPLFRLCPPPDHPLFRLPPPQTTPYSGCALPQTTPYSGCAPPDHPLFRLSPLDHPFWIRPWSLWLNESIVLTW